MTERTGLLLLYFRWLKGILYAYVLTLVTKHSNLAFLGRKATSKKRDQRCIELNDPS